MNYDELKMLIEQRGVHPALGPTGQGYNIEQNPHELAVFLEDMLGRGVRKVLEIGSGYRMGLSRFLANDLAMQVVTIDRIQPDFPAANVQFLMGSSEILRPLFEGAQFDLVIIDGDNSYEGVGLDYASYGALATKAIAICKVEGLRGCDGVRDFWQQIKGRNCIEAIDDSDGRSGIAWVIWDKAERVEIEEAPLIVEDVEFYQASDSELDAIIHEPIAIEDDDLPKPIKKPRKSRKRKVEIA